MDTNIKYVIITPVRDEEQYIEKTISSVTSQTLKPVEWIIVNDGSVDNTGSIIDKYATEYSWIKTVHRSNRGFRKAGGGVIEAFYAGYNVVEFKDWDFIVKLDGDLSFETWYFEKCFQHFDKDSKIGGLINAPGWDTVDEVKANMLGWETKSFSDLQILHLRYTGGAEGTWRDMVKHGRANYIAGYHPLFMLLKCTKRMFQKPFLLDQ